VEARKIPNQLEGEDLIPSSLKGKTIAILATDGFERSELIQVFH